MEIARLYREAQRSFVDLVRPLTEDQWATPSPCTPGWTVRDVLSHVAGVTIDIVEGNLDGVATDPWTAVQVERWRDTPVAEMLERWDAAIGPAAEGVELFGEILPVFDCHTHEHDVRTALGRPGNRDSEPFGLMLDAFSQRSFGRPVTIHRTDGPAIELAGDGDPLTLAGVSGFEVVRSRLGRRSAAQVRSWEWSEPVDDDLLAAWFAFGPATHDIDE